MAVVSGNAVFSGGTGNDQITNGTFDVPDNSSWVVVCADSKINNFYVDSYGFGFGFGCNADNPLMQHVLPILMAEMLLVGITTRLMYYLLRPLKQPRIVSDILGGILLSPTLLGGIQLKWNGEYEQAYHVFFPLEEFPVYRTIACIGLMFYLFLVCVKMDPALLFQSGRKAWFIGLASLLFSFASGSAVSFALRDRLGGRIANSRFIFFAIASGTITAFPVLADILAELHLLNSDLGRLAMSCAMVHGVFGALSMSLFTALNQSQGGWDKAASALLSLAAIVLLVVFAFRRWMLWIVRQSQLKSGGRIEERHLFGVFISVVAMGLASDYIGASFVFVPMVMGLAVPDGPPLGAALVEKAQLIAQEAMLPLLFAIGGMEVDVGVLVREWKIWTVMCGVMFTSLVSKLVGTMVPAMYCKIPMQNAFVLGLMMNFRGLMELITFLNFRNGALLGQQSYTVLLLFTLIQTAIIVPLVAKLYDPMLSGYIVARRTIQHLKSHAELRILACVQSEHPIPSILRLLEASCPTPESPLCVYVLHMVELRGRANSTLIAHKNKKGFINPSQMDRLHNLFINFEQCKRGSVAVQPFTTVAPIKTMHHDVCSLAGQRNVALVIVPYRRKDVTVVAGVDSDNAIQANLPHIVAQAPCSVGILIHSSIMTTIPQTGTGLFHHNVGVLFWGGPDDREALAYAARMVRRTGINLSIAVFVPPEDRRDVKQRQLDEELLAVVKLEHANSQHITMEEFAVKDIEQTIGTIKSICNNYHLLVVGRQQGPNSLLDEGLAEWSDCPELGVVGDMLASNDFDVSMSILVMQQHA